MRTKFLSDPLLSPFGRRRRALAAAKQKTAKTSNKKVATAPIATKPVPTAATVTSTTSTTGKHSVSLLNKATSRTERLHLVLKRRSKQEMGELTSELHAHAHVKMICIYTDSPLLSHAPLSQRQQRKLLTQTTEICSSVVNLQLDFSSEFGNTGVGTQAMELDCELLANLLKSAPQLEALSLKEVPLSGNVESLKHAFLNHPSLKTVELKWCSQSTSQDDTEPILSTLLTTFLKMPKLNDLTLLLSSAHNLPLPQLAHSSSIQMLTLGLEQRHVAQPPLTVEERKEEQALLMHFLKDLQFNTTLQECTLFSHHWKTERTLEYIQAVIANKTSNLRLFHLTDYNYGSDDPRQLLELATTLQTNTKLQQFKIFSKKRLSNQVDKKTRRSNACAIDTAFVECLQQNTSLQQLEIVHAGIQIGDAIRTRSTCKACAAADHDIGCMSNVEDRNMIPFLLMTNRCQARQQFLLQSNITAKAWRDFVVQHKSNTPLIYYLLQENPSLLLLASGNASEYIWEYYF